MSTNEHEALLQSLLERIVQSNQQVRPGTPMAELKESIEQAIISLPPLEFEDFGKALDDRNAEQTLIEHAPELIGWDADKVVEWVEEIAKKL